MQYFTNKLLDKNNILLILINILMNESIVIPIQINKTKIIIAKQVRWWINVPVKINSNKIIWIKMLADSAADKPCVNRDWALKHFKQFIQIDKHPTTLSTPNGFVTPKECLFLSFPANNGTIYRAKFVLLPQLPAPILADINMLDAFGYKFTDEIPPIFRHHAPKIDKNIGLKEGDEKFKINSFDVQSNWRRLYNLVNSRNMVNNIQKYKLVERMHCLEQIIMDGINDNWYDIDHSNDYEEYFHAIDKSHNFENIKFDLDNLQNSQSNTT